MKITFSIGEMSKLHNTTIQTLRYYDEIGLLVPIHVDEKSGYRYYSTEQFEQLNTINYLKDLGFSLKEIKTHVDQRSIEGFINLLQNQKKITDEKIRELQRISAKFEHRMTEIIQAQKIKQFGVVIIQELSERKILKLKQCITSEPSLEISLRNLENMSNVRSSVFIGGVGLTVDIENAKKHKFDEYNSIFILYEDDKVKNEFTTTLPKGRYACIYFRGNRSASPDYYEILLDDIEKNGLQIIGDSIERTLIDHSITMNTENHITEIQIPVW